MRQRRRLAKERQTRAPSKRQYQAIAHFRHQLRCFLAFSEAAAAGAGAPAQQHQALLAIAGWGEGTPTVGALAERLLIAPHTGAELIDRMARAGLLKKRPSKADRRKIELVLTQKAAALLRRLTSVHVKEIRTRAPSLIAALRRIRGEL